MPDCVHQAYDPAANGNRMKTDCLPSSQRTKASQTEGVSQPFFIGPINKPMSNPFYLLVNIYTPLCLRCSPTFFGATLGSLQYWGIAGFKIGRKDSFADHRMNHQSKRQSETRKVVTNMSPFWDFSNFSIGGRKIVGTQCGTIN